jgi:hypothetical protein
MKKMKKLIEIIFKFFFFKGTNFILLFFLKKKMMSKPPVPFFSFEGKSIVFIVLKISGKTIKTLINFIMTNRSREKDHFTLEGSSFVFGLGGKDIIALFQSTIQ